MAWLAPSLVYSLLLSAHELEVVDLLELGDDELAPHVGDLHLQLVDLHVAQLHRVVHVVHLALGRNPPVVVCRTEDLLIVHVVLHRPSAYQSTILSKMQTYGLVSPDYRPDLFLITLLDRERDCPNMNAECLVA